jgi:RNA polymerase subunit RPABC4/transcription elongation factor Spt4
MNYYNIKQCAWCKRIKNIETGIWGEIADMILDVSHTICPVCRKELMEKWNIIKNNSNRI